MADKNIVSIEDRIPKLKQARKKKANRRLIFYLSIFFILLAIIIYLQSSLSHVNKIVVTGNHFIEEDDIIELSDISYNTNYWTVDKGEVRNNILNHREVKNVEVDKRLPSTVILTINEYERIGYIQQEGQYIPVLETGELLRDSSFNQWSGDAPLLEAFEKQTYLQEMAKELNGLPKSITHLISEIKWQPKDGNPYKIKIFMNDGYEVEGSIRNFSETMKSYPSVVSQLEPGSQGIIYISENGAYFDPYVDNNSNEDLASDEEDTDEG